MNKNERLAFTRFGVEAFVHHTPSLTPEQRDLYADEAAHLDNMLGPAPTWAHGWLDAVRQSPGWLASAPGWLDTVRARKTATLLSKAC